MPSLITNERSSWTNCFFFFKFDKMLTSNYIYTKILKILEPRTVTTSTELLLKSCRDNIWVLIAEVWCLFRSTERTELLGVGAVPGDAAEDWWRCGRWFGSAGNLNLGSLLALPPLHIVEWPYLMDPTGGSISLQVLLCVACPNAQFSRYYDHFNFCPFWPSQLPI